MIAFTKKGKEREKSKREREERKIQFRIIRDNLREAYPDYIKKPKRAYKLYKEAAEIAEEINEPYYAGESYWGMSHIMSRAGEFEEAIKLATKAQENYEASGDNKKIRFINSKLEELSDVENSGPIKKFIFRRFPGEFLYRYKMSAAIICILIGLAISINTITGNIILKINKINSNIAAIFLFLIGIAILYSSVKKRNHQS